jgi:tRNA (cmo5U34)-methyltransferase
MNEAGSAGRGVLTDLGAVVILGLRELRSGSDRARIPEPMVIADPAAVARFSEGGATQPLMRGVYDFNARALSALIPRGGRLLDLGVGAGQALAYLLHRRPDITAIGLDLSPAMLAAARDTLSRQDLAGRVRLDAADITDIPPDVRRERVDAVSCLWTLHQLPDTEVLTAALRQIAALRNRQGMAVWLLDFQRLTSSRTFPDLLTATEPDYPALLREDAVSSEAAAFRAGDLRRHLDVAGLGDLRLRTTWPLRLMQACWAAAGQPARDGARPWTEVPLDRATKSKAFLLRRAFGTSIAAPLPRGPR